MVIFLNQIFIDWLKSLDFENIICLPVAVLTLFALLREYSKELEKPLKREKILKILVHQTSYL